MTYSQEFKRWETVKSTFPIEIAQTNVILIFDIGCGIQDKHKYHFDEQYNTLVFPLCCKQKQPQLTCEFAPAHVIMQQEARALDCRECNQDHLPTLWIRGNNVVNNLQSS